MVATTHIGIVWEKTELRWMARQLNQQLTAEFTQTVQLAALLTQHEGVRAAFHANAPRTAVQDTLNRLVLETSRVAILVADAHGNIIATGVQDPDFPRPFATVWDARSPLISPATLSRRFVAAPDGTWMFEIATSITGPSGELLGFIIVYQSFQGPSLVWSALPEHLSISTSEGVPLYDNYRPEVLGWTPLQATMLSRIHGTSLLIERNPRVLLVYTSVGFMMSLLLVLAAVFRVSSALQQRRLTDAKIGALAKDAATLETRVQKRTRALSSEIKQHKQTEMALKKSQSLLVQAARFKVLNNMASGLSHEISQPLFALVATLSTLKCQLGTQSEAAQASLEKAQRVTKRIGRILNNLKSFAREEQIEPVPVELSKVIASALEILEHEAARSYVTIEHIQPPSPLFGMATPTRLQQVLVNLVSNSIDAVANDGTGTVRIDYEQNSGVPKVRISDNGPGFSDKDAVLTPFFTTKGSQNGLGLGLSISAEIMQVFGGSLELSEAAHGGASVVLRFRPNKVAEQPC